MLCVSLCCAGFSLQSLLKDLPGPRLPAAPDAIGVGVDNAGAAAGAGDEDGMELGTLDNARMQQVVAELQQADQLQGKGMLPLCGLLSAVHLLCIYCLFECARKALFCISRCVKRQSMHCLRMLGGSMLRLTQTPFPLPRVPEQGSLSLRCYRNRRTGWALPSSRTQAAPSYSG